MLRCKNRLGKRRTVSGLILVGVIIMIFTACGASPNESQVSLSQQQNESSAQLESEKLTQQGNGSGGSSGNSGINESNGSGGSNEINGNSGRNESNESVTNQEIDGAAPQATYGATGSVMQQGTDDLTPRGIEGAAALQENESVTSKQGSESAVSLQGSESAVSLQGSENAVALQGSENAVALQGSENAVALQGSENAVAQQGTGTSWQEGNENTSPGEGNENAASQEIAERHTLVGRWELTKITNTIASEKELAEGLEANPWEFLFYPDNYGRINAPTRFEDVQQFFSWETEHGVLTLNWYDGRDSVDIEYEISGLNLTMFKMDYDSDFVFSWVDSPDLTVPLVQAQGLHPLSLIGRWKVVDYYYEALTDSELVADLAINSFEFEFFANEAGRYKHYYNDQIDEDLQFTWEVDGKLLMFYVDDMLSSEVEYKLSLSGSWLTIYGSTSINQIQMLRKIG